MVWMINQSSIKAFTVMFCKLTTSKTIFCIQKLVYKSRINFNFPLLRYLITDLNQSKSTICLETTECIREQLLPKNVTLVKFYVFMKKFISTHSCRQRNGHNMPQPIRCIVATSLFRQSQDTHNTSHRKKLFFWNATTDRIGKSPRVAPPNIPERER